MFTKSKSNLKAIEEITTAKCGGVVEMLWLNMGDNHQIWAAETHRNSDSAKTVKLWDSVLHWST